MRNSAARLRWLRPANLLGCVAGFCSIVRAMEPPKDAASNPPATASFLADATDELSRETAPSEPPTTHEAVMRSPTDWPNSGEPLVIQAQAEEAAATTQAGPTGFGIRRSDTTAATRARTTGSANVVSGDESRVRPSSDVGSLLGKSESSAGLVAQKRTPIVSDPRLRGTKTGELQASGSYWLPARLDLDTMVSKIDSSIISEVIGIKGPYASRYGLGFTFLDIGIADSPRYANGPEWHGRTSLNYQTNGEQWYGRQTVLGGSADWGVRVGYGHRTGNDYDDGDGDNLPTSYNSRDVDTAIGFDLSADSRIEFHYMRLDQTDVEFPGQIFDIDFLVTDAYKLRYELKDQAHFDRLSVEAWYNRTRFEGNAQRSGKRRQIPELQCPPSSAPCLTNAPIGEGGVLGFIGFTDVDSMSTGYRIEATWGDPNCSQLTAGVDLRYVKQELNEFDTFQQEVGMNSGQFTAVFDQNFPIPRSHSSDPGLFVEHRLPVDECLSIKSGARLDWVSANIEGSTRGYSRSDLRVLLDPKSGGPLPELDQNFALVSAFVTAEYKLNESVTASAGFGHAERPPTLTELYAVEPFLAILQQGFSTVKGNLELNPERLWQTDLGFRINSGRFRGGVSGFYAWINDYITYEALGTLVGVPDALDVRFVNTDWATLSGGELSGEYDLSPSWTPFATLSYVEGRDHSRGNRGIILGSSEEPLPGIAPLESRVGIRYREAAERPRYGIELAARIVDNQDRVATSLLESETAGFTTFDVRGYWQATESLLLVAGVENFTDKNYREHLDLRTGRGVFQPGASFYFGLDLSY